MSIRSIKIQCIFLILIAPLCCLSQWSWQNPLPQGNNLSSVRFIDQNTAFAVGDGGTIMKTTDKGVTWTRIYLGAYQDLTGVFFVNQQVGFVTGANYYIDSGYIFKTSDGGNSWTKLPVVFDWPALCVWFTDENTGFVGTFADLYKTIDGGVTWNLVTQFPYYNTCWSIYFTDIQNGFIGTSGHVFKTSDGGSTWNSIFYDPAGTHIMSLFFTNQQTGFGVGGSGYNGKILKTTDAGLSWNTTSVPDFLNFVFFANNQTGFVLGLSYIYKTNDGGITWAPQLSPVTDYLMSGSFSDSLNAILVGYHGATVLTNDMGLNWNAVSSHATVNNLWSIYFIGNELGYASGDSGTIIKTTDGGNSWHSCQTGTNRLLYCLFFTNSDTGYVCGSNNTILKTTNGGTNWSSIFSSTGINDFNTIVFPSFNTGYALGPGLIKTTDGGNSWAFKSPTGISNNSMCFTNENTGYICGDNGQILKTTDGGNSYIFLNTGMTQNISSIYFTTKYTGFITGNNFVAKTTNEGETWSIKFSDAMRPYNAHSMHFSDSLHGFLVAVDTVLITNNGGETWQITLTHDYTKYLLDAIWFTDSLTGFITGENGIILKTTSGGVITGFIPAPSIDYINVYPNPNSGEFQIQSCSHVSEIQVYNLNGFMVYKSRTNINSDLLRINMNPCNSGIYILRIVFQDRTISKKLIVIKD